MDFFRPKYNSIKCKTALGISLGRVKLLQNKKAVQVKAMRREIANLMSTGKDESARIRVEAVMRELSMITVLEILELFLELVTVRLRLIEAHAECPLDLREAITTLMYTSTRTEEIPDLTPVRKQFTLKYGKEFTEAVTTESTALSSGVNLKVFEKLAIRAPNPQHKVALLQEIAAEHGFEWNPKEADTSILGPQPDLIDFDDDEPTVQVSTPTYPLTESGVPPQAALSPDDPGFFDAALLAPKYTPPTYVAPAAAGGAPEKASGDEGNRRTQPQVSQRGGAGEGGGGAAGGFSSMQEAAAAAQVAAEQAASAAAACAELASRSLPPSDTAVKATEKAVLLDEVAPAPEPAPASEATPASEAPPAATPDQPSATDSTEPAASGPELNLPDFLKPAGAVQSLAPAAPPAPTLPTPPAPTQPDQPSALPAPTQPAPPPPPPAATDSFDDLAKRFEALKNRR